MPDKYIEFDDTLQSQQEVEVIDTSAGAADAGKLIGLDAGGLISPTMLPVSDVVTVTSGEALLAGDFIYIDGSGEARKASAASGGNRTIGYVKTAVGAATSVDVFFEGRNSALAGLTAGDEYFLDDVTAGAVTNTAPTTSGSFVQSVGFAISATEIVFEHGTLAIRRA